MSPLSSSSSRILYLYQCNIGIEHRGKNPENPFLPFTMSYSKYRAPAVLQRGKASASQARRFTVHHNKVVVYLYYSASSSQQTGSSSMDTQSKVLLAAALLLGRTRTVLLPLANVPAKTLAGAGRPPSRVPGSLGPRTPPRTRDVSLCVFTRGSGSSRCAFHRGLGCSEGRRKTRKPSRHQWLGVVDRRRQRHGGRRIRRDGVRGEGALLFSWLPVLTHRLLRRLT